MKAETGPDARGFRNRIIGLFGISIEKTRSANTRKSFPRTAAELHKNRYL